MRRQVAGTILLVLLAADNSLGLSDMALRAMGVDASLTGRTDIWEVILEQDTDPILGEGAV